MTYETVHELYEDLQQAVKPEDIFGSFNETFDLSVQGSLLEEKYRELLAIVDVTKYADLYDQAVAEAAKIILDKYYVQAKEWIAIAGYGEARHVVTSVRSGQEKFQTERGEYILGEAFVQGDHATLYEGEYVRNNEAVRVAIKITDSAANNSLITREARTLEAFYEDPADEIKHFPILLDQFQTDDGRSGLVFRYADNCFDLYTVRENFRYKNGVHRKHMVWMLNRALSALTYAHAYERLHGNIEPSHLMIRPRDHNMFLVGWGHSIFAPKKTGENFSVYNSEFSAPEVKERGVALRSADIYSLGMCMVYILGGNVAAKTIPDDVEDELANFLGSMILESPFQRAQSALVLKKQLNAMIVRLWGPKKFLVFEMD